MRAYVVASNVRIAPFGDLAKDLPIGGAPLVRRQEALFHKFGLEPKWVDSLEQIPTHEPRIVTFDHIFFSRRVLKSFLHLFAKTPSAAGRVALPLTSGFVRKFTDLQSFDRTDRLALFDLYALPAGLNAPTLDLLKAAASPLEVIYREKMIEMRVPQTILGVDHLVHPVTSSICLAIDHWLHLLHANFLSIQVRWVDEVVGHPLMASWFLLKALLSPGGTGLDRLLRSANRFEAGVDVHPSARVEGCFLGAKVKVGAGASVRASIVGAGTVIEPFADVEYSVLGDNCFVSKHSMVTSTAAMDGSDLCMRGMQMCLVGRRVGLTARAIAIDTLPGGPKIRVRVGDRYQEVNTPILGSCFGHDSFIGADVFIAPGREIPNGVRIAPPPERILAQIPANLEPGRAYVVRNSTLELP